MVGVASVAGRMVASVGVRGPFKESLLPLEVGVVLGIVVVLDATVPDSKWPPDAPAGRRLTVGILDLCCLPRGAYVFRFRVFEDGGESESLLPPSFSSGVSVAARDFLAAPPDVR